MRSWELRVRPALGRDRQFLFEVRRAALRRYVDQTSGWDDAEQRAIADEEFGELPYAVVEEDGRPVGHVCVRHAEDHDFVEEIALLPEAQGRGIGTRLVRDVQQAARRRGVPVRLSVFSSNPAQALYARLGFTVTRIEEPRTAMEWRSDMEKVDYDARLHAVYAAGRRMTPEARRTWTTTFARHVPERRPLSWLDLGSGTGRMTPALADAFGGPVHGVEPSDRMRAQAAEHPAVTYTAGAAEEIPLPDGSCDAALVFFVWHHVRDRVAAARELRRVVRPGGTLFVQANLADRMPGTWWFRVVPEWLAVDRRQFRTRDEVRGDFAAAGWALDATEEVTWLRSESLAQDLDRLRLRAVSVFEHMDDDAIEAGFAKIDAALPGLDDGPQYETSELLVFR